VTVVQSIPTDGRVGIVKNFVALGKTRVRVFIPTGFVSFRQAPVPEQDEPVSGPAVAEGQDDLPLLMTEADFEPYFIGIADSQAEIDY
jgi:hypothetical protein